MSLTSDANPLLDIPFQIPFDRIRSEQVEPAVGQLLEQARARLEELSASREPRTFENTMCALDDLTEPLGRAVGVVRHLESVATYPALREAYNAIQPPVSAFYSSIPLHEGLWNAIRQYAAGEEAQALTGARARFVKKTVDDFRRHGAGLDPAGKARLKEIDVELAELTTRFGQNVLDSTNAFELVISDEAGLAGLPPTAVDEARQSAAAKGLRGWRFTLKEPSYLAVMTYLDDRRVREQVYRAHTTRATAGRLDNRPLIARILELRRARARLLGFRDFADLVLEDRMAHSGDRALAFLEDLKRKTQAHFERENREIEDFRRQLEGPSAGPLEPWDIAYYAEKMRKALYDIDQEMLRPYFPLDRVVEGMFEVTRRLYGIQVKGQTGVPSWDPHTRYYTIHGATGEFLGAFFADWFPRENKRGGAWMDALITGVPRPHLGLICGNLTPPAGGKPALLTHREVETIFHEFGHLLHHLLSEVEIRSLAGTNVAWDFVELPSQIMENWCWEREALDLFARHYQTGDPIPGDLLERIRRARTFRSANGQMRQLGCGFLDLGLHKEYEPERDGDVIEHARRILQSFTPAPLPPDYAMPASFSHLFASPVGYGAGYYSYKWAEVLDADAFTRFRSAGVFDAEVGLAFRRSILSKGDSADPAELYRSFMGRDPDPAALLERLGLT